MSAVHGSALDMTQPDVVDQFRDAMRSHGIEPPDEIVADGELHRFAPTGRAGDDAGYYVLHTDGLAAGCFGDWRAGLQETWRAKSLREMSEEERAVDRDRIARLKAAREAEQDRRRQRARAKASALWQAAGAVGDDHPYLARKQVAPVSTLRELDAARVAEILGYAPRARDEALSGRILIAPVKVGNALSTAEMIDEAGRKSAVYGGQKRGSYWAAAPLPEGSGEGYRVFIGEGVATVTTASELTGDHAVAALSCRNLEPVARAIRHLLPRASLVILADLGNGTADARAAAAAVGARLISPDFGADRPEGATDFNDLAVLRGRAIALEQLNAAGTGLASPADDSADPPAYLDEVPPTGSAESPKRAGLKYSITIARDFRVREDLAYFIKGIWDRDTFGVTWGPSGGGKSFVTADMALHVVSGRTWCGRRVRRGGVVYLGAEGPHSMERRFIAMASKAELDLSDLPLAILSGALHMLRDPDGTIAAVADAAQQLRALYGVEDVLLIVDTMARSAPGMDENGPEDMGAYVGACDRVRIELGIAVVVVHHAGKDLNRGARGHGALKAAADCELLIADHQISIEKLRDGATGSAIPFTLHPVELARDLDGDPVTTCWIDYGEEADARRAKSWSGRIAPTTQIAFEALREAVREHGGRLPATSTLPEGKPACNVEQWRQRFYSRIADRDSAAQRKAFQRAKDDLVAKKIIGTWETWVWIW